MTTARLLAQVAHFRAQLLAQEEHSQRYLDSMFRHTLLAIQPELDRLYDQMMKQMSGGEKIPLTWLSEAQRLENIKKLIASQIGRYGETALAQTLQGQRFGVQLGYESGHTLLQATVPTGVQWSFGRPDIRALANMVGATQAGTPLGDLFAGFGAEAADAVGKSLVLGVSLGRNPRMVARDVEQKLNISRARALTISRTEMLRCYRLSNLANYRENSDVVQGWIWVCALQRNSCAACIAMHGTKHSLDEELQDHPCGRCAPVPETKSWEDILGPLGIDDTSDLEDTRPQFQSGSDWLDNQSEETQRAILGAKYDGWSNGDFSLKDIVGINRSDKWGDSIQEKSLQELTR